MTEFRSVRVGGAMAKRRANSILLFATFALAFPVFGNDPEKANGLDLFEKKIRPILAKQCYSCHSGNVQAKGGLRLDTKTGVLIGGTSGPAIVPGDAESSLILSALRHESFNMPPAGKLSDEVIADFADWIKLGAPDPREESAGPVARSREIDYLKERENWIFRSPARPRIPVTADANWSWNTIDQFVRSSQEAAKVHPVGDAEPIVWLRRVSFDLIGLPPTIEQIAAIEKDPSRQNRERVVDALLASPRFGERWGRHWLDIARFAESTGKERNFIYQQAWRYRDWVIDALNTDKPYNQFLSEQIAGDLLPFESPEQRDAQIIATGFLALGPKGINERNREAFLLDVVDEQIENVGRAVAGLSISCARCHDHLFDPISSADYYAIAGIFRSSDTRAGILNRQRHSGQLDQLWSLASGPASVRQFPDPALVKEVADIDRKFYRMREDIQQIRLQASGVVLSAASAQTIQNPAADPSASTSEATAAAPEPSESTALPLPAALTPEFVASKEKEFLDVRNRLDVLKAKLSKQTAYSLAIGLADRTKPQDVAIRIRGEVDKIGQSVPRGFLTVIALPSAPTIGNQSSGRLELAEWLTRPDHPLTSRVIVNRLWGKLFGAGLVPTVDDFGSQGQPATHPELIDYLAIRFTEKNWSIKSALKEMVLSRTYQLKSEADPVNDEKDQANVYLWRANRKRLDAEAIRDAMLEVSGQLDLTRPFGSPVAEMGVLELGPDANYALLQTPSTRRSVYLPVVRGRLPEPLVVFDMADPSLIVGQRESTTSPTQALYLLNSPFALERAEFLARRILAETGADDEKRIERAYLLALSRRPAPKELERAIRFLQEIPAGELASGERRLANWTSLAQTLLALPEFRYIF